MQVRFSFLAGLAVVLLLIPINRMLATRIQKASVEMMAAKDERIQWVTQLLTRRVSRVSTPATTRRSDSRVHWSYPQDS